MRLWLRERHGIRAGYSQEAIDHGRQELGFESSADALVAYTLFGGDLVPGMLDSLGLTISADQIAAITAAAPDSLLDAADLLVED